MHVGTLALVWSRVDRVRNTIEKRQIDQEHPNLPLVLRSMSTHNAHGIETDQVHTLPSMLCMSEHLP